MKIIALLLLASSAFGQSVLFNGNSPVAASDPIGTITGAGAGLTVSTGTTFTSSVTVNGVLAASSVTVTGNGSGCFTAGGLKVDCNLNQEYLGTGANISTFSAAGALSLAGTVSSVYGVSAATGSFGSAGTISTFSTTGALTIASGASLTANTINGNGAGVTISSNAVVTGTATVQGNAFSVGTSSFSVTAGSATVAYSLQATTLIGTSSATVAGVTIFGSSMSINGASIGTGQLAIRGTAGGTSGADRSIYVDQGYVYINNNNASNKALVFGDGTAAGNSDRMWLGSDSLGWFMNNRYGAGVENFRIMASGEIRTSSSVSVGNGSEVAVGAGTSLLVSGVITQTAVTSCATGLTTTSTGAITGCVASDVRLKKAIRPLLYSADLIDNLRPRFYEWKDKGRGPGRRAGFIAQEVRSVFPEGVVPAGNDLFGVDPNALIAVLVKEVQQLRKRVEALESRK